MNSSLAAPCETRRSLKQLDDISPQMPRQQPLICEANLVSQLTVVLSVCPLNVSTLVIL